MYCASSMDFIGYLYVILPYMDVCPLGAAESGVPITFTTEI